MVFSQKRRKRISGGDIVRAIEEKTPEALQPARPLGRVHTSHDIVSGKSETLRSANCDGNIFQLMPSKKIRLEVRIIPEVYATHQASAGPFTNGLQIGGRTDDYRFVFFDYAGF